MKTMLEVRTRGEDSAHESKVSSGGQVRAGQVKAGQVNAV